jgi:hypothetical protein
MHSKYSSPLLRHLRLSLFAICATFVLLQILASGVFAAAVNVYDNAGVLNTSQVQSAASQLKYPIDIYTTNKFTGTKAVFGQETDGKMRSGSMIMAIDTVNKYVWIDGRGVPLSSSQYQDAASSFASDFRNNNGYTSAVVSAINSLNNSLSNASSSSGGGGIAPAPVSGGGFNWGAVLCIGFLVVVGLVIFGIVSSRRRSGGFGGFRRNTPLTPPYDPNYGQPYNQGGYPPNYGPGYPQQGQGMNPWAAGGLGAAAGGLLGYELGKDAGENENRNDQGFYGGDQNNNYDGGGGAGADFGGGDSGGAGADFGGGGGGDFGGGGGGAGSDF